VPGAALFEPDYLDPWRPAQQLERGIFSPLALEIYAPLPKWRRGARPPSCLDLITLLRKEMVQQPALLDPFGFQITDSALVQAAAA
jgi:hypothetical protein